MTDKRFPDYAQREINKGNKLQNSEQSYKGKVKTHKYINRQISQQPENCENRNDPDLVQVFLKKWWFESDFKAPILTPQHFGPKLRSISQNMDRTG
jgi:hypothetical protein